MNPASVTNVGASSRQTASERVRDERGAQRLQESEDGIEMFYLLGRKCSRPGYAGISDVFELIN
jgi:hypothetical protein